MSKIQSFTAAELLVEDLGEIRWCVPGLGSV